MRLGSLTTVIGVMVTAVAACLASAEVVHFDTPAEYETQFYDNSNGPIFNWDDRPGVRRDPGFIAVADLPRMISTALYRRAFDLSGGRRHVVDSYFYTGPKLDGALVGRLGFAPTADGNFSGGQPWVAVSLRGGDAGGTGPDYGEDFGLVASHATDDGGAEDVDGATPVAEAFSLSSSHWYKLATGWTYAGGGTFHYEATLTDYGRAGEGPGPFHVGSIRGSLVNPDLADPAAVASMFAGVRADARATVAWDDFEARAIPEPGAAAFVAVGVTALLLRRRRRA